MLAEASARCKRDLLPMNRRRPEAEPASHCRRRWNIKRPEARLGYSALVADTSLRQLERRWRETGSEEHHADVLRELVRVGRLAAWKLELAAHVGHPAACLATGRLLTPTSLAGWGLAFGQWDQQVVFFAAGAVARAAIPLYPEDVTDERPLEAAEFLFRWIESPLGVERKALIAQAASAEVGGNGLAPPACHVAFCISEAIRTGFAAGSAKAAEDLARSLTWAGAAISGVKDRYPYAQLAEMVEQDTVSVERLKEQVQRGVAPYCLGDNV